MTLIGYKWSAPDGVVIEFYRNLIQIPPENDSSSSTVVMVSSSFSREQGPRLLANHAILRWHDCVMLLDMFGLAGSIFDLTKDGPGPVMVSDTLCPAAHILGT